jgi:hypothetical protein
MVYGLLMTYVHTYEFFQVVNERHWIPACAGMTVEILQPPQ